MCFHKSVRLLLINPIAHWPKLIVHHLITTDTIILTQNHTDLIHNFHIIHPVVAHAHRSMSTGFYSTLTWMWFVIKLRFSKPAQIQRSFPGAFPLNFLTISFLSACGHMTFLWFHLKLPTLMPAVQWSSSIVHFSFLEPSVEDKCDDKNPQGQFCLGLNTSFANNLEVRMKYCTCGRFPLNHPVLLPEGYESSPQVCISVTVLLCFY